MPAIASVSSSSRKPLWVLLAVFAVLYGLVSLVNHYLFRTYALDLGFYTKALYDYRHFQWNYSEIIFEQPTNMLGGHFEPILFLLAPLSFLFGSYTLPLVQMAFLLWGGYGVYQYFRDSGQVLSLSATAFFLGYFSVFGALAFDFHTNVIAASLVPFLFLAVKQNRPAWFAGAFVAILLCKENMAIWLFFIGTGLALQQWKNKPWRNRLLLFSGLSLAYFGVLMYAVIPQLSPTGAYTGFLYTGLGNTPQEAVQYMLSHPVDTFIRLFTNTSPYPVNDGYKAEFHMFVLLTGLPLLLFRPGYVWMLLPLYLQKMLHDQPTLWGIAGHYGVEFAPIMTVGVFEVIRSIRRERLRKGLAVGMAVMSLALTFHSMDITVTYTDKNRIRIYQKRHYSQAYAVQPVHRILNEIPADAGVSAQTVFVPHLALREHIYQFPIVKDATYIVYSLRENSYPYTSEEFLRLLQPYTDSPHWEVWRRHEDFYVLRKRAD